MNGPHACSGGANVAELADRELDERRTPGHVLSGRPGRPDRAHDACSLDCARKVLDQVGLTNYVQVRVTDLDMRKVKGEAITKENVDTVVARVKQVLKEKDGIG